MTILPLEHQIIVQDPDGKNWTTTKVEIKNSSIEGSIKLDFIKLNKHPSIHGYCKKQLVFTLCNLSPETEVLGEIK